MKWRLGARRERSAFCSSTLRRASKSRGRPGMPKDFSAGETARQMVLEVLDSSATSRQVPSVVTRHTPADRLVGREEVQPHRETTTSNRIVKIQYFLFIKAPPCKLQIYNDCCCLYDERYCKNVPSYSLDASENLRFSDKSSQR